MRILFYTLPLALPLLLSSCGSGKQAAAAPAPEYIPVERPMLTAEEPMAVVYKMNGDYASLVPVNLNAALDAVVSYPAPSDVVGQEPVALKDGYYLDRRGIGPNTAFLGYTYAEYAALPQALPANDIMRHIRVARPFAAMYRLPVRVSEAMANPKICDKYIESGFKGCTPLITPFSVRR